MSETATIRKKLRDSQTERNKKPLGRQESSPANEDPDAWANRQRAQEFAGEPDETDEVEPAWQEGPEGAIVTLDVEDLVRHPDNRVPTKEEVEAKAESIAAVGQLEPVVVWQPLQLAAKGKYQLLSGETRWLGIKKLGRPTIQARIAAGIDHAQALELLARYNGERKDLDPIQRAKLAKRLCQPREEGGAGLTTDQAAPQVGLKDGSAVSNLVKVLDLPGQWQERVAAGELPHTWARPIARVAQVKPTMEWLETEWERREEPWCDTFRSRELLEEAVEGEIEFRLVELSEKQIEDLDPDVRQELELVELELSGGGRGKTRKATFATNTKLWEKLEQQRAAERTVKRAAKAGQDEPPAKRELSPAEQRERDRERAEQLKVKIAAWRHDWLKSLVSVRLEDQDWVATKFLTWVLMQCGNWTFNRHCSIGGLVRQAMKALDAKPSSNDWKAIDGLHLYAFSPPVMRQDLTYQRSFQMDELLKAFLQLLLQEEDGDKRHPLIPHEVLDGLARDYSIDLAKEWTALQATAHNPQRFRFEAFFELHQSGQLDQLGEELGVYTGQASTKQAKVKLFITRSSTLPLPKSIAPLPTADRRPSKPKVGKKGGAK